MVEIYGQEIVNEVGMQEEAKSQVLAELPEALFECVFGESDAAQASLPSSFQNPTCNGVISAAKDMGITPAQVESAIGQLDSEEDRIEILQGSLAQIYSEADGEDTELGGDLANVVNQLPEKFSNCREEEDGLDTFIPDVFQSPLCGAVVTEAMEAGVSYAMAKGILNNLTVDEESQAKKKPRTVAKP